MKIAVIGAGITGVLTAYYLSKRGFRVHIFDKEQSAALKCSYANGGQLSASNSEVWNSWSTVYRGIKWLFDKQAPLLIRPKFDLDQWRWLMKFLSHTFRNHSEKNTAQTIGMSLQSRELYKEIMANENLSFDYNQSGILHIYKNTKYWHHAKKIAELYTRNGCEWTLLNPQEALEIEPALYDCQGIIGASFTKDDAVGDIHQFCQQLLDVCVKRFGVQWNALSEIHHVRDLTLEYDFVVVAAGVYSNALAKTLGDQLDIYPVKGYSITVTDNLGHNQQSLPRVSLLDDETKIVTSTLGNRFRVAGTAELNGLNYEVDPMRIQPLFAWVNSNFPKIDTTHYSMWSCLRPMTPNMMPVVRASKHHKKIFYHTGHGHLGWTLSPYTAIMLVNQIEQQL